MRAFLDESGSDQKLDPNTYLLSAAICSEVVIDSTRSEITSLQLKGQRKVHWRMEGTNRRREIASAIATFPVEHLVVVFHALKHQKLERRRRLCLARMLFELDELGVKIATFESRGPSDDRKDLEFLMMQRTKGAVSNDLRMEHRPGPGEPMKWIPDAICGSVSNARCGENTFLDIINASATVRVLTI